MLECQQNEVSDFGLFHSEVSAKPLEKCLTQQVFNKYRGMNECMLEWREGGRKKESKSG